MIERIGRIVVGYDGSEPAARAVDWAAVEAAGGAKELVVFYVVDYGRFATGGGDSGGSGWASHLADEPARLLVERGVARAREAAPGVSVRGLTQVGRPFAALVEASRDADAMVVGTRGHGRLHSLVDLSVATSLASQAHCPVVIVRGDADVHPDPAHPVVVGVDGSAASQAALDHAAGAARETSAPLVVVCAWNDVAPYARWVSVDTRVVIDRDDLLGAERRRAQAFLDAATEHLRTEFRDVSATASPVEGPPDVALLRAGADAGLVVVGNRGRSAAAGSVFGSVSQAVVRGSKRPVAVVRAEVGARAREARVAAPQVAASR